MRDVEPERDPSHDERLLHEVNASAEIFFRQELLQTTTAWPTELLKDWGVEEVLERGSVWQIGYAPDGGTQLMDHLLKNGFGRETLMRAGLVTWTDDAQIVDRHRDQLMMVSRDRRLDPVGFVSIDREGAAQSITPPTLVHRSSEALVGVLEQIGAFEAGATAVIVDHPLDAIGIEVKVRESGAEEYVGIPLLGSEVSDVQAQILRQFSRTDRLIVMALKEPVAGSRAVRNGIDLTSAFDHVRLLQRPPEPLLVNPGPLTVLSDLLVAETATTDRGVVNGIVIHTADHDDPGPSL